MMAEGLAAAESMGMDYEGLLNMFAQESAIKSSRRLESFSLPDTNEYQYFPSFLLRGLTRLDVDVVPAGGA